MPGTALFLAHQAVADLDWNPNSSHSFSAKYYYQHDPTIAPYAYSMFAGFAQHLDAGSQVIVAQPHANREVQPEHHRNLRFYPGEGLQHDRSAASLGGRDRRASRVSARLSPGPLHADCTINNLGSPNFPGHQHRVCRATATPYPYSMNIGAGALPRERLPGYSRTASIPPPTLSGH